MILAKMLRRILERLLTYGNDGNSMYVLLASTFGRKFLKRRISIATGLPRGFLLVLIPLKIASPDKPTRRRDELSVIFGFPGTLNVEWKHRQFAGSRRPRHAVSPAGCLLPHSHRARHRTDVAKRIVLTEQMFTAGTLTSGCLDVMLESLALGKVHSISVSPGTRGLTDWRALCTVYGDTVCELHNSTDRVRRTLRDAQPFIRSSSTHFQLQIISVVCSITRQIGQAEDGLFDLRLITRDGSAFAALMRCGCTQARLLAMLDARALLARIVSRYQLEVADRRLSSLCKRVLNVLPVSNLLVKVPYHHTVHRGALRQVAMNIIGSCHVPKALRSHLLSNLRVVFTKRATALDTLTVHRRFAADMVFESPPQCTCCALPAWFPRLNGHVCVRSSDLLNKAPTGYLPLDVRAVLSLNSKDTLWPHGDEGVAVEIARGLRSFVNRLAFLGAHSRVAVEESELLDAAERCTRTLPWSVPSDRAASIKQACFCKRWLLRKGLLGTEVDKNRGDVGWMCPAAMHALNVQLFAPSESYVPVVTPTQDVVRDNMRDWKLLPKPACSLLQGVRVRTLKDSFTVPLNKNQRVPLPVRPVRPDRPDMAYGYGLIKDKSWAKEEVKGRPLGACCNLSTRTGNYEASRVLYFVFSEVKLTSQSFHLQNCTDLDAKVTSMRSDLLVGDYTQGQVHLRCSDVEGLYTNLTHPVVMEAARFFVGQYKSATRSSRGKNHLVSVPIRGKAPKKGIHRGKSGNPSHVRQWTLDAALAVLEFDLRHAFIVVGDRCLRQVIGIVMGSSLSPIAALMALAWMEHRSWQTIPRHLHCRLRGCRLMDDIFMASVSIPGDPESEAVALGLLTAIKYHKNLTLERTDLPGDDVHRYLEGVVSTEQGSTLSCDFFAAHNAVSLSAGNGCVKPRFRSWNSYGLAHSKCLVIYGFFQRMRGYSSDVVNTQSCAGAQLLRELVYTGYPVLWLKHVIKRASATLIDPAAQLRLLDSLVLLQ